MSKRVECVLQHVFKFEYINVKLDICRMENISIKVENYSNSEYYIIKYRRKRKILGFLYDYNILTRTRDIDRHHPVFFNSFDSAVYFAKEIKKNPNKIAEHIKKEDDIYNNEVERRSRTWESI